MHRPLKAIAWARTPVQSACKGGRSLGPGANVCKGMGFAMMSKGDCVAAKGQFKRA
jgi:hypothetical protein